MPHFIAALVGGLVAAVGSLVGRVLLALGVGFVVFTGLSSGLSAIGGLIRGAFVGLPVMALDVLSAVQLDVCLNIILSAYAARFVLMGLSSGTITRMIFK